MWKFIVCIAATWAGATSQPVGTWKQEMTGSFNFSNARYDNWTAGGEDAINWNTRLKGKLVRELPKTIWKSSGKLGFGMNKIGSTGFRKSMDEIFLESIYSYKLTKLLNPFGAVTLQSQFARGYDYTDTGKVAVSAFWDPGYVTQSVGMGFRLLEEVVIRLGFSLKETFSTEYNYADDPETSSRESFRIEPGLESVSEYAYKFNKILVYNARLSVFINFKGHEEIDGRWENSFTAQVAKYLNVNFGLEVFYDKDMDASRQIKQELSIGLNYTFL